MSPTVHRSSRSPKLSQALRGNAPKDGTSWLILSNMKTFMTPDAPYMSAARTCMTHNTMFIAYCSVMTDINRLSTSKVSTNSVAVSDITNP